MNTSIMYGNKEIHYTLIRSQDVLGKIRIHVYPNACIEVEAPQDNSDDDIKIAIRKRARWISNQLDDIEHNKKYVLPREYVSGETHFYIGRRYSLKIMETKDRIQTVKLKSGRIEVTTRINDPVVIRRKLKMWYQEKALEYFQKRIIEIVDNIDWIHEVPPVKIVKMQKQWGSCTPDNTIHLNPWLIRASSDCIDYVIIHELCHLCERNHSKAYYTLLGKYCANWRQIKIKLDGMAELLLAE